MKRHFTLMTAALTALAASLAALWLQRSGDGTYLAAATPEAVMRHGNDEVRARLSFPEGSPRALQPGLFRLTLEQIGGETPDVTDIRMTLSMPAMFCGSSKAVLVESRPGVYEGQGVPLMSGRTSAQLEITLRSGDTLRASLPFVALRPD